MPGGGYWRELLNSDAAIYGGSGMGNLGGVEAAPVPAQGRFHSAALTLPPLSTIFLKPRRDDATALRAGVAQELAGDGRARAVIEDVAPAVDAGRFAVKRVVGDCVEVEADCYADGHDLIACVLSGAARTRPPGMRRR